MRSGFLRSDGRLSTRAGAGGPATRGSSQISLIISKTYGGVGSITSLIHPIGFLSDHMEVLYDLDEEARLLCEELGLNMVRARTVGTHPRFVSMLRELIAERMGIVSGIEPPFTRPGWAQPRRLSRVVLPSPIAGQWLMARGSFRPVVNSLAIRHSPLATI